MNDKKKKPENKSDNKDRVSLTIDEIFSEKSGIIFTPVGEEEKKELFKRTTISNNNIIREDMRKEN